MKCNLCDEIITEEHEKSAKHINNKILADHAAKRKQLPANKSGIKILCTVATSFSRLDNCTDGTVQISTKPNEEIKFRFEIKNESKDEVALLLVEKIHDKMNFILSNTNLSFGCPEVKIKPNAILSPAITVTFCTPHVGQYNVPIIFSLRTPNEAIVLIRDVVVFVEMEPSSHEKLVTPYTRQNITAERLYRCHGRGFSGDEVFKVPPNYKQIFARDLKLKEDAPEGMKTMAADISESFRIRATKENYITYFHNLLWFEETIARINLKRYNMSSVPLIARANSYELFVPGMAEKRPSLLLGDLIYIKPHERHDAMFEAVLTDMVTENSVLIGKMARQFKEVYKPDGRYDVRFIMSRAPLERMHHAVHRLGDAQASTANKRVFPQPNKTKTHPKPIFKYFNPRVEENPEQSRAVQHMVCGSAGVAPYLLHGPPGTGKTVTIVEAILQLIQNNPNNRVMVCTDSNMAADHVATVLLKYSHFFDEEHFMLRANSKYRVWESLPKCLYDYSNGSSRESFAPVSLEEFQSYSIVITTLSHAAKFVRQLTTQKGRRWITHLFIDEAAQASEPACLIPVTGLLADDGALVLAGDPRQLGPVVISHSARRHGLGLSLMERLQTDCSLYNFEKNDPSYTLMLRNNFRSDPAILDIPNELFYNKQLRAQAEVDPLSAVDILGERQTSHAVVFHGVLSKEQRMGKSPSYFNTMELEIVQLYIKRLINHHKVRPEDIGVVTPYIRQVYKVKEWLKTQKYESKIEVGTVEAFQGKEKRVIIISTVRASCDLLAHDAKFQLGFLVDDKRFNVALTRAKAKAIIIGNPLCLEKDAKWRQYIQKCRDLGTHFGYDTQNMDLGGTRNDIVNMITRKLEFLTVKDKL